jgi:hypothetical protein
VVEVVENVYAVEVVVFAVNVVIAVVDAMQERGLQ